MDKKEAAKIFGENLRKIRTIRGITQEELSEKLGYSSRSSINKIESGERDMPRSKIALAAKILGVSPLELFKNDPIDNEVDLIAENQVIELQKNFDKLSENNKMRLNAYIQALLDSQEDSE